MTGNARQDLEARVHDYVLGLLSPEEAASVERALHEDAALRLETLDLRERLLDLDVSAKPEDLPDDLWARIEAEIEGGAEAREADEAPVVDLGAHRKAAAKPVRGYWQGFATAAIASSLLFMALTGGFFALRSVPEPVVIAVLLDSEANPGVIVEAFGEDRVRILPLVDIPVPAGRALEVWTLPDPETGPVSLGLLPAAADASLGGFDLPRPNAEQLYEITLEPETGSPTGRPTGPVLFKGFAKIPL